MKKTLLIISSLVVIKIMAVKVDIVNKSRKDIEIAVGTPSNKPDKNSSFKYIANKYVGKVYTEEVPGDTALIMIKQPKGNVGYLYEGSSLTIRDKKETLDVSGAKLVAQVSL